MVLLPETSETPFASAFTVMVVNPGPSQCSVQVTSVELPAEILKPHAGLGPLTDDKAPLGIQDMLPVTFTAGALPLLVIVAVTVTFSEQQYVSSAVLTVTPSSAPLSALTGSTAMPASENTRAKATARLTSLECHLCLLIFYSSFRILHLYIHNLTLISTSQDSGFP